MNNEIIFAIIMNVLYIIMWFIFNKIRSSQNSIIRDWDNGNEFYESLNENDKDQYWKEDTHILNIFFMMLFLFLDAALFLHYAKIDL